MSFSCFYNQNNKLSLKKKKRKRNEREEEKEAGREGGEGERVVKGCGWGRNKRRVWRHEGAGGGRGRLVAGTQWTAACQAPQSSHLPGTYPG